MCVCLVSDGGESSILWHIDDDVAVWPGTVEAVAAAIGRADTVMVTFEMPPASIRVAIAAAAQRSAGGGPACPAVE